MNSRNNKLRGRLKNQWIPLFLLRLHSLRRPIIILVVVAGPIALGTLAINESANIPTTIPRTEDMFLDMMITSLFLLQKMLPYQLALSSVLLVDILGGETKRGEDFTLLATLPIRENDLFFTNIVLALIFTHFQLFVFESVVILWNPIVAEKNVVSLLLALCYVSFASLGTTVLVVALTILFLEGVSPTVSYMLAPATFVFWHMFISKFISPTAITWVNFFLPIVMIHFIVIVLLGTRGNELLAVFYSQVEEPISYLSTVFFAFLIFSIFCFTLAYLFLKLRKHLGYAFWS